VDNGQGSSLKCLGM